MVKKVVCKRVECFQVALDWNCQSHLLLGILSQKRSETEVQRPECQKQEEMWSAMTQTGVLNWWLLWQQSHFERMFERRKQAKKCLVCTEVGCWCCGAKVTH